LIDSFLIIYWAKSTLENEIFWFVGRLTISSWDCLLPGKLITFSNKLDSLFIATTTLKKHPCCLIVFTKIGIALKNASLSFRRRYQLYINLTALRTCCCWLRLSVIIFFPSVLTYWASVIFVFGGSAAECKVLIELLVSLNAATAILLIFYLWITFFRLVWAFFLLACLI